MVVISWLWFSCENENNFEKIGTIRRNLFEIQGCQIAQTAEEESCY